MLIATDTYDDPEFTGLVAPAGDADALAEVLGDPGVGQFEVTVVSNGTAEEIERSVKTFLSESEPDDVVLVYFSCHGVKNVQNRYYLAARDSRADRMPQTGLNPRAIHVQLDECDAKTQVVILDCCFSGAFRRGMVARGGDTKVDLPQNLTGRGRIILTSSTSFQYSYEEGTGIAPGLRPRSVFTSVLLDGIRNGLADRDRDGYVSVSELYEFVHERLADNEDPQTPEMYSDGRGSVWIARNPYYVPYVPSAVLPSGTTVVATAAAALRQLPHGPEALASLSTTFSRLWSLVDTYEGTVLWRDVMAAVDPPDSPTHLIPAVYDLFHALDSLNNDAALSLAVEEACAALAAQVADGEATAAVGELLRTAIGYLGFLDKALTRIERQPWMSRLALAARPFVEAVARTIRRTSTENVGSEQDPVPDQLAALTTIADAVRALALVLRGLGGRGPASELIGLLAAAIRRSRFTDTAGASALTSLAVALRALTDELDGYQDEDAVAMMEAFVTEAVDAVVDDMARPVDEGVLAKDVHGATSDILKEIQGLGNVHELLSFVQELRTAIGELHRTPLEPDDLTELATALATGVGELVVEMKTSRDEFLAELRNEPSPEQQPAAAAEPSGH